MSELQGILDIAADNEDANFRLTATSQAVILFALDLLNDERIWRDFPDEDLTADLEQIHQITDDAISDVIRERSMGMFAGFVIDYPGEFPLSDAALDAGWLACDGQQYLKTDWPDLYAAIGELYTPPTDDDAYFRVPNYADRSTIGRGAVIGLAAAAGEFTHALTADENGQHSHTITDPGHHHTQTGRTLLTSAGGNTMPSGSFAIAQPNTGDSVTGITINNSGSGTPHNNLHPVMGVNKIILGRNP